jgi:hypothetical protein
MTDTDALDEMVAKTPPKRLTADQIQTQFNRLESDLRWDKSNRSNVHAHLHAGLADFERFLAIRVSSVYRVTTTGEISGDIESFEIFIPTYRAETVHEALAIIDTLNAVAKALWGK